MRFLAVTNRTRKRRLGARIRLVDSWFGRLRGFLGHPEPEPGEGLLIEPCRAVHMFRMAYPLDVAFVARDGTVVAVYPRLQPGRRSRWHPSAAYALELRAGTLEETGTRVGDELVWTPVLDAYEEHGVGAKETEARTP